LNLQIQSIGWIFFLLRLLLTGIRPRGKSVLPLHVATHTNIETASLMFPFAAFNATELSIIHFL
jgi:hypothetical protein